MQALFNLRRFHIPLASAVINLALGLLILLIIDLISPIGHIEGEPERFGLDFLVIAGLVPVMESLLLVVALEHLRPLFRNSLVPSLLVGISFALLHLVNNWRSAVIVTLPFIFQCYVYCKGRAIGFGFWYAFGVICFVHAFNNATGYCMSYLWQRFSE